MTTRLLPVEEWSKLDTTDLAAVWRTLNPGYFMVVVAEEGDQIIGTWTIQLQAHVEGLWIHPDHRNGGVLEALWVGMEQALTSLGATSALTVAGGPAVERMLKRRGADPVLHYRVPFQAMADRRRGRDFHTALVASGHELDHPHDDRHDEAVGQALRVGIDEHDPPRAQSLYNAWAATAGYAPLAAIEIDGDAVTLRFDDQPSLTLARSGDVLCLPPR